MHWHKILRQMYISNGTKCLSLRIFGICMFVSHYLILQGFQLGCALICGHPWLFLIAGFRVLCSLSDKPLSNEAYFSLCLGTLIYMYFWLKGRLGILNSVIHYNFWWWRKMISAWSFSLHCKVAWWFPGQHPVSHPFRGDIFLKG